MAIGDSIKKTALKKITEGLVSYLCEDPERRLNKTINTLYSLSNTFSFMPVFKTQIKGLKQISERNLPSKRLVVNLFKETDPSVMKRLAVNFAVNAAWAGVPIQRKITKKEGINVPFFLLIDPTERCNYKCTGCWAGSYDQKHELTFERFDSLLQEAKELGIYFIVISGGEPTIYPKLFEILERHTDMAFMMYTNGSLIDEKMAGKMKKAGNIIPCFSVEGFEKNTDLRRGKGAWQKVMTAMDNLRKAGVPFGYSVTETKSNIEEVLSDEFVDFMIDKGAKIAWYFQYIPTGRDPDVNLMLTPEQRKFSYERVHYIRSNKPIFVADFWNDGPYTGGCIAGGRRYIHITADGGVEPCAFIHLSQGNINEISLKEAIALPFFKEIQKLQPYSDNLLRPCMLVDNPEVFRKIGSMDGVRSTDGTLENMSKHVGKHLDKLSDDWEKESRPIFERDFPEIAERTRDYKKLKEKVLQNTGGSIEQFYVTQDVKHI